MESKGELNPAYFTEVGEKEMGFNVLQINEYPSSAKPKRVYDPKESRRMLRNVFVISIAFTFLFTAFQGMAVLQSSINAVDGLGNYSLSTLYGALVVSCMFFPTLLIQKFTVKWTLCFSTSGYIVYIGLQFYPEFYTLIPGAVLLGLGAACLWSAKCTYLTHLGHEYAALVGDNPEVVIVRFFGIFFLFFQSSNIWGNLISSQILSSGDQKDVSRENISRCGSTFCPSDVAKGALQDIDDSKVYTLAGIYVGCAIAAAVVIGIVVDPLIRYGEKERDGASSKLSGLQLLTATARHMRNPYQILIIPLTIWSGLEQGFLSSDYTQAYISCSWGAHRIGYIMICYGVCDAIGSISFGPIIRMTGRIPIFIFAALLNGGLIVALFLWSPDPDNSIIFYVIAGLWGLGDAVWQTQINAFYGVIFPHDEEAAFSNYRLWESLGFIIAYINGNNVCVNGKLWLLVGMITLGMIGYMTLEFLERKKTKRVHNN